MLGVSNPIENEPSPRIYNKGTATEYRNCVQCMTVLYAMLFWLESEKGKKSVWKDISARYWLHNGKRVLESVRQSLRSNTLLRNYDKKFNGSESSRARERGKRGEDLVARLEKAIGSLGAVTGEQRQNKYRY